MFYPVEGGSIYEVKDNAFGFVFKCHLPPVGYGVHVVSRNVEPVEVIVNGEKDYEQRWVRPTLPSDYKKRLATETERRKTDPQYFDFELQKIRKREWHRRLYGVWFKNYNPKTQQVEDVYLTGAHYLYISWWKFQGKYMNFRIPDMEVWYALRYCEHDPDSLGLNFLTRRKFGKTAIAGCWIYERTSRAPRNQHGGIQSKTDDDGEEFFKKGVIQPWQKLPDFFKPIYNTLAGDDPSELRFFHPSRRGASADTEREADALESWIDYGSSGISTYDGPELDSYVADEAGKLEKKVSIIERQNTVRYCSELEGVMKGKQFYTTTVEKDEDGSDNTHEFEELVLKMSNALNRNANNRTSSGLYTLFMPTQMTLFCDEYGWPDVEKAELQISNTIEGYRLDGNTRAIASYRRKMPRSIRDAFASDGSDSLYDPELIEQQLEDLKFGKDVLEHGDLEWEEGKEFWIEKEIDGVKKIVPSSLRWVPKTNGKYQKVIGWQPRGKNNVIERAGKLVPNFSFDTRIGCDPFRYDKTKDKRRSNAAAYVYQMSNDLFPNDQFADTFVMRYCMRTPTTRDANYDVLKMAWYCGSQVLFERNVNHWKDHFAMWNCSPFLMFMPGEEEPGVYTTSNGVTSLIQTLANYTEAYINQHIKKVYFPTLLNKDTGWLGFKVEDTQKFDEPMAAGVTLLAVHGKVYRRQVSQTTEITKIFRQRKRLNSYALH